MFSHCYAWSDSNCGRTQVSLMFYAIFIYNIMMCYKQMYIIYNLYIYIIIPPSYSSRVLFEPTQRDGNIFAPLGPIHLAPCGIKCLAKSQTGAI